MATIYQMVCPKCGQRFSVMKGILMSECGKPIPAEREEETPFKCPKCGRVFRTTDDDFHIYVETFVLAD